MKALVLSHKAVERFLEFAIEPSWFESCELPIESQGLKRAVVNDIVYLIEGELNDDNVRLLVVDQSAQPPVLEHSDAGVAAFDRLLTVALSHFSKNVSLPTQWRPYREGSTASIYAASKLVGAGDRLIYDSRPQGESGIFAFARTQGSVEFNDLVKNDDVYRMARAGMAEAILAPPSATILDQSRAGIVLTRMPANRFMPDVSVEEWYASRLTNEQRQFVDRPHDGPVRLRGAAGTGKTLALVVKMLRDAQRLRSASARGKFLFVTHSAASVEHVSATAANLEPSWIGETSNAVEVRTLYDVAHHFLRFDLDQLSPLSLDGREGRRTQHELVGIVLETMSKSTVLRARFSNIADAIRSPWRNLATDAGKRLITDLANEIASVLDAEGIRAGEERGERYAKGVGHRASWLMSLTTEAERRFVLEVHARYRQELKQMNTLSIDQMIADFNSFLDSNRWDRLKERDAYDAVFVDELHLFTSMERQTLHKLIRPSYDASGTLKRPPIFMAYDLKQSPRDAFTQYEVADNNLFGPSSGLQNSELIKLSKVFRYTPEIASFLEDLDASFPAIDIPGEWDAYAGEAQLESGVRPTLTVYPDDRALFRNIFQKAETLSRRFGGDGRGVAVLCLNDELFDVYARAAAGQFSGRIVIISGRDGMSALRHAGKRFVFSMPEYVAGLQFDTVFLVHVDMAEATADATIGIRRRFVSNVYLGASRAERVLELASSVSRGGPSSVLELALTRGTLVNG